MTPSVHDHPADFGDYLDATPVRNPLPGSIYHRKVFILVEPALAHVRHGWVGRAEGWFLIAICLAAAVLGPALSVPPFLGPNPPVSIRSQLLVVLAVCFLIGAIIGIRVGIADLTDRTVIDRRGGWISREWLFGTAWEVHRSGLVAIQCLHGGWERSKHDHHEHFQLNLVMADGSRLHVCSVGDERGVRELAGQLGDFLQLPVSDQIDESRAPKPSI